MKLDIHLATSKLLTCSNPIQMSFPEYNTKLRKAVVTQDCRFPGHMLYYAMQQLWGCRQQGQESKADGWLSEYQISHRFSNPGQMKVMYMRLAEQHTNYIQVQRLLENEMAKIYTPDTIEEWMDENIIESIHHLKEKQEKIKGLQSEVHWERRPLRPVVKKPTNAEILLSQSVANTPQFSKIDRNIQTGQGKVQSQSGLVHDKPSQTLPMVSKSNKGNIHDTGLDINHPGLRQNTLPLNNKFPPRTNSLNNPNMGKPLSLSSRNVYDVQHDNNMFVDKHLLKPKIINQFDNGNLKNSNLLKKDLHIGNVAQMPKGPMNDMGLSRNRESERANKRINDIPADNLDSRLPPSARIQKGLGRPENIGHQDIDHMDKRRPMNDEQRNFKETHLDNKNMIDGDRDQEVKLPPQPRKDRNLREPGMGNEAEWVRHNNDEIDQNNKEQFLKDNMNNGLKMSKFPNDEIEGLSPSFVEALRKKHAHPHLSNEPNMDKALFPDRESMEEEH